MDHICLINIDKIRLTKPSEQAGKCIYTDDALDLSSFMLPVRYMFHFVIAMLPIYVDG